MTTSGRAMVVSRAPFIASVALFSCALASAACEQASSPLGRAGPDCDVCVSLARDQSSPSDVALDATSIYWLDRGATSEPGTAGTGAVLRASLDGSTIAPLDMGLVSPMSLVIDATSVYWATPGTDANDHRDGALMKVDKDGSGAAVVASGLAAVALVAVDDENVYWVSSADATESDSGGPTLFRAAKDGSGATRLLFVPAATALAADDSGVYVVDGPLLERVSKETGQPELVTEDPDLDGATGLALDATSAYWISGDDDSSSVFRVSKDGSGFTALSPATDGLRGLAVDGTFAYWTTTTLDGSNGLRRIATLWKVQASGGDPSAMATMPLPDWRATGSGFTGGLAVDAVHVYATGLEMEASDATGSGELIQVPK